MVKLAMVGLGRIGKSHAVNLLQTPGCQIVGACSVVPAELDWAKENLNLKQGMLFRDYQKMLENLECDTVFLATSSNVHSQQIIAALKADKHVFCEKPLGTSLSECKEAARVIAQYQSRKVFMLGFVRRFDPAYAYAKKRIQDGAIGTPYMVRSQTADHADFAPFQVEFTASSGGIFYDMSVHDIDLIRWLLESEAQSVYAVTSSLAFPEFGRIGDADNGVVTCQFSGGKVGIVQAIRNMTHGHDTLAEIYGTKGVIRVGFRPSWTDVTIMDAGGQRDECVYTFFDRFSEAFRLEVREFIACINEGRPSPIVYQDGVEATRMAEAFTRSMKEKRVVNVNEVK